jgi:hypothetical protein
MVERDGRRIVREDMQERRLAARHDHARHCAQKGLARNRGRAGPGRKLVADANAEERPELICSR